MIHSPSKRHSSSPLSKTKQVSFSFTDPLRAEGFASFDEALEQFQSVMDRASAAHYTRGALPETPLETPSYQHVDTPIPSPHVETKGLPFAMTPDETVAGPSQSKRFSAIASPISPGRLSSGLVSPPLVSMPIAQREEEQEQTSTLGIVYGPPRIQEHVFAVESAVEQDEEREIDELLGVKSEASSQSISSEGGKNGKGRNQHCSPITLPTAEASSITGPGLAAVEEHLFSPTSTLTPSLGSEPSISPSTARAFSPYTPFTSPEMGKRSSAIELSAEGEGARSSKMEHESLGSWSSQGGRTSGRIQGESPGPVIVGEGHDGVVGGTAVRSAEPSSSSSSQTHAAPVASLASGSASQKEPGSVKKKSKKKKGGKKG